jgi:hypothetical protein
MSFEDLNISSIEHVWIEYHVAESQNQYEDEREMLWLPDMQPFHTKSTIISNQRSDDNPFVHTGIT